MDFDGVLCILHCFTPLSDECSILGICWVGECRERRAWALLGSLARGPEQEEDEQRCIILFIQNEIQSFGNNQML